MEAHSSLLFAYFQLDFRHSVHFSGCYMCNDIVFASFVKHFTMIFVLK